MPSTDYDAVSFGNAFHVYACTFKSARRAEYRRVVADNLDDAINRSCQDLFDGRTLASTPVLTLLVVRAFPPGQK